MFHRFVCVLTVTMMGLGCANPKDQQDPIDSVTAELTAKVGTYKSTDELPRVLEAAGFSISSSTAEILLRTPLAKEEMTLEFVVVTMEELGFGYEGATTQEVYSSARRLGMVLCPAEAGPQLRLRYRNLPQGNWFTLGMDPIMGSDGIPRVFHMGHDGRDGQTFETLDAAPKRRWNHLALWIFVRNKAP